MILSALHNRKFAALLPLLAMTLFIAVNNVHTDDFSRMGNKARVSCMSNVAIPQIAPKENGHAESHCAACEMLLLGAGNTITTPVIHIQAINTQETFISASQDITYSDCRNLLTSRAPPV